MSSWTMVRGKFLPTDEELIIHLKNKVEAGSEISQFIVEEDIYSKEPWMLNWSPVSHYFNDERYFLIKRELASKQGKRKRDDEVKRTVDGENVNIGGIWRQNSIIDFLDEQKQVIGHKTSFTFASYKNKNSKLRKDLLRTRWVMQEYTLRSNEFQEWAICRIRNGDPTANNEFLQLHHPQVLQQLPKQGEEGATDRNNNELKLNTTSEELINNIEEKLPKL